MESGSANDENFEYLVKLLESGKRQDFKDVVRDMTNLKKLLYAKDQRKEEDDVIPRFKYRYRPIYREGMTILHYAMIYGDAEIVENLLKKGADPKATTKTGVTKKDQGYHTVVHIPCYIGNLSTLKNLLSYVKAKPDHQDILNFLVTESYQHTFDTGRKSHWKWTPLHYACGVNNLELVNLLVAYGADPMEHDGGVLRYASKVSDFSIVKFLIQKHREKNTSENDLCTLRQCINFSDAKGKTALHYACQKKCLKTLEILLEYRGDPTIKDKKEHSPLHYAILNRAEGCAMKLLNTNTFEAEYIAENLLTSVTFKKMIDDNLGAVITKILKISDTDEKCLYCVAYKKTIKSNYLLHIAVLGDSLSTDEFLQIVKGLGKNCIEDKDRDGMTPMMLAAANNLHKQLKVLFHAYIELLDQNMFFIDKIKYISLYKEIVVGKCEQGLSMAHLAILCRGSESDFEDTIKVINSICEVLKNIYDSADITEENRDHLHSVKDEEKDPFLVQCICPNDLVNIKGWNNDEGISPLQLAFLCGKPERAVSLIKITKGRTLRTVDKNVIYLALLSGIPSVNFKRMTDFITNSLEMNETDIKSIFNYKENDKLPLHVALEKKLLSQAKTMINLKTKNSHDVVDLNKYNKDAAPCTLHIALTNGSSKDILDLIMERNGNDSLILTNMKSEHMPQIKLPLTKGIEAHAINAIVSKEVAKLCSKYQQQKDENFLIKIMKNAVKLNRVDVFKMLIVQHNHISLSIFKSVILKRHREFARILVRYTEEEALIRNLLVVVKDVKYQGARQRRRTMLINVLIEDMPDVALEAMNRSATFENESLRNALFLGKNDSTELGRWSQADIRNPLNLMVDLKREKILQHSLLKSYLKSQWKAVGFWVYLIQVTLYTLFIIPFSALVEEVPHPNENINDTMYSAVTIKGLSGTSLVFCTLQFVYFILIWLLFQANYNFVELMDFFRTCCNCYNKGATYILFKFVRNISTIFSTLFKTTVEPLIELTILILVWIFSIKSIINTEKGESYSTSYWRVGLFAIILAWSNFIIKSSKLPEFGKYTLIFINITKTFLKMALFGFVLVMAFAVTLRMVFYHPLIENSPFYTFSRSIVKLITTVSGELDFQDIFGISSSIYDTARSNINDQSMAYFVWILFIIGVPILFSNMLIALAVGDATEINQKASIKKLELFVYWVTALQNKRKHRILIIIVKFMQKKYEDWINSDDQEHRDIEDEEDILLYSKERQEDIDEIRRKYSDDGFASTDSEKIKTINEVIVDNQNRLREVKEIHDAALQKLHHRLDYLIKSSPNDTHQDSTSYN